MQLVRCEKSHKKAIFNSFIQINIQINVEFTIQNCRKKSFDVNSREILLSSKSLLLRNINSFIGFLEERRHGYVILFGPKKIKNYNFRLGGQLTNCVYHYRQTITECYCHNGTYINLHVYQKT